MELNRSSCWYSGVCQLEDINCTEHCLRYDEMSYLMTNSDIPRARQTPVSLIPSEEDYDAFCRLKEIKDNIVDFVDKGSNLFISSKHTGNGKTSWAIKIMLKYFDSVWAGNGFRVRGVFVNVPTLLSKLKDFNNPSLQEYKNKLLAADLVIWDDIASSGISNYDYNQLLIFIDNRLLEGKANIFTSNVSDMSKFKELMGEKLASRVYLSSEIVEFKSGDRR